MKAFCEVPGCKACPLFAGVIALLLLAICLEDCGILWRFPVPAHKCTARQGAILVNADDCIGFQRVIDSSERELVPLLPALAQRLSTVQVYISERSDGGSFEVATIREDGGYGLVRVASISNCGQITLAAPNFTNDAVPHELAHIGQCPFIDYGHVTWADAGLWDAVQAAKWGAWVKP